MRKILLLTVAAASLAGTGLVSAREPSQACQNGEVPPSTTAAGIGVRQAGDPYQEPTSLYVCSTTVAPGAVWVRTDTPRDRNHVIIDGDSNNQRMPCSDGYTAVRADGDGTVRFYQGDNGDFSFISRERSAETWARAMAACAVPDMR